MTRRIAIAAALTLLLGAGAVWAHDGHTHTVMGTVTSIQPQRLEVKTNDGKTVTIVLNDKTTFVRGAEKLTPADLAAGQRVVVDVGNGKEPLTARGVKLGAAKVAAASK
jgi:hypothetical protein